MDPVIIWLILASLAAVIEILHQAFAFIFVCVAALLAAGAAALGLPLLMQVAIFAVASVVSLVLLRPIFAGRFAGIGLPSRTDALIGQVARVVETVDPVLGSGRVIVAGHDWAARSRSPIAAGQDVRIDGADGIVLLVSPSGSADSVGSPVTNAKESL